MDGASQVVDFFLTQGAAAGLLGAVLAVAGSHFAFLDLGMRKNQPLHKEPVGKQLLFVLCGLLVGAIIFQDSPDQPFVVYAGAGAGWLFVLKGMVAMGQTLGEAMRKYRLAGGGGE